jgi:hypothetical protein
MSFSLLSGLFVVWLCFFFLLLCYPLSLQLDHILFNPFIILLQFASSTLCSCIYSWTSCMHSTHMFCHTPFSIAWVIYFHDVPLMSVVFLTLQPFQQPCRDDLFPPPVGELLSYGLTKTKGLECFHHLLVCHLHQWGHIWCHENNFMFQAWSWILTG